MFIGVLSVPAGYFYSCNPCCSYSSPHLVWGGAAPGGVSLWSAAPRGHPLCDLGRSSSDALWRSPCGRCGCVQWWRISHERNILATLQSTAQRGHSAHEPTIIGIIHTHTGRAWAGVFWENVNAAVLSSTQPVGAEMSSLLRPSLFFRLSCHRRQHSR